MCDTGAGMYPRSRNVYGVARWWRIGTARNPRVLTTAPLAPDVVPEVKPTIIGAPGSIAVSTCGVARWASSHETPARRLSSHDHAELQVDARGRGGGVEHVDVVVPPELGRPDHAHRLHHPHDLGELVLAVDRHHRHRDRAGRPHPVRDRQRLPPVGQLPHDGVAGADAVRVRAARRPGAPRRPARPT